MSLARGRADAAAREQAEIDVLSRYLPQAMTESATLDAMRAIAAELGLAGKKDMGRLMKEVKARHPSVDGKMASNLAADVLG